MKPIRMFYGNDGRCQDTGNTIRFNQKIGATQVCFSLGIGWKCWLGELRVATSRLKSARQTTEPKTVDTASTSVSTR